jgi:phage anti-repressor protein
MSIEKIIIRVQNPKTAKRQLFVSAKKLHRILECDISYKTFIETNVIWSRLRENIDYHFNNKHDTYNLSICAVQAILIMENTELSWKLFNELSDLINSGFPTILNKGDNHVSNK